jgi:molybdopterin biosynthesis enzyme
MVRANGLIVLPEEQSIAEKGEEVTVQLLNDALSMSSRPDY